jgi:hypothetical protein
VGGHGFGTRTFWTVAIPDSAVTVNFGAGRAEMHVDNLSLGDYTRVPIALGPNWQTAFGPAVVSFDVVWSGPITRRVSVEAGTNGNQYAGDYVENQVSVTWSGTNLATGFSFTSNLANFSTSLDPFAELGHEGNGIFFDPDSADAQGLSAALAQARAASATVPVTPGTTLLAPPGRADHFAAHAVGNAPVIPVASGPDRPAVGAAHPRVLDHVFADLDSSTLGDLFGGDEVGARDA